MEKSKCCEKCYLKFENRCFIISCPCHKPSVDLQNTEMEETTYDKISKHAEKMCEVINDRLYGCGMSDSNACNCHCHTPSSPDTTPKVVTQREVKAMCRECKAEFTTWLSDSNECPSCEGEVIFFDCLKTEEVEVNKTKCFDDSLKYAFNSTLIEDLGEDWEKKCEDVYHTGDLKDWKNFIHSNTERVKKEIQNEIVKYFLNTNYDELSHKDIINIINKIK